MKSAIINIMSRTAAFTREGLRGALYYTASSTYNEDY
jgi:hypothetical protein